MSDQFLGEIRIFAFNFNPTGWLQCNGQTLAISQYAALFALVGTYYGGNGTSTFAVPNLQSRVPIHQGTGPGLSTYVIGEVGGVENVSLLANNMPIHSHLVNASSAGATVGTASGNFLASAPRSPVEKIYTTASDGTLLAATTIASAGGNVPHTNIQPFLTLNFCIATVGIFPSRN